MKKLLLILTVLLISKPAYSYSNNMGSGMALGMATGVAIASMNHEEPPLIEKLIECENGLKPELVPSQDLSFEQRYYDCKRLIDKRENWNNSYERSQKKLMLFLAIIVVILTSMIVYIIYDSNRDF